MTVQELINELMKIEDKNKNVLIGDKAVVYCVYADDVIDTYNELIIMGISES
jgi:hypothetical protein